MKEVRYFYVPDAANQTELPQEEAMHAMRVLRLKEGDEMFLMDGEGSFYRAQVLLAAAKRCVYQIIETNPQEAAWDGHIHLAIAPTKMIDRIEWMAEKATEIGFDELSFLKTIRIDRVEKIVVSAVKQSRKAWMPKVNPLVAFKDFVSNPPAGRRFIAHCYTEIPSVDLYGELQKPVKSPDDAHVTVLVGPEGDFSIDEVRMAIDHGFVPVTLGKSRLRTETAGLYAVMLSHLSRQK